MENFIECIGRFFKKENKNSPSEKRYKKLNEDEIRIIGKVQIFRVQEICDLLGIEIPESYSNATGCFVDETDYFLSLENAENIIRNVKIQLASDIIEKRKRRIKRSAQKFKKNYEKCVDMDDESSVLLENFIKWLYIYFPRNYSRPDYFNYKLYDKNLEESESFISYYYGKKIWNVCNPMNFRYICDDKSLFNQRFSKYVNRDFIKISNCTFEDFENFIVKHPRFFIKPLDSNGGRGARIHERNNDSLDMLFEQLKVENVILEEVVRQHYDMSKFNPDSINTIRVCTLLTASNEPLVIYAGIRVGRKGKVVDNFAAGGMTAAIDVKTGIIYSDAMDKIGEIIELHPDSGVRFKGSKIPCWDKVLKIAKEAALETSELRYIGWDVVINEDGEVQFIEGNTRPAFYLVQAADQIGKKHLYEEHVNEIEKKMMNLI